MRTSKSLHTIVILLSCLVSVAQDSPLKVSILMDLDASGGVTSDKDGNIYISDFGKQLGAYDSVTTKVYQWDPTTEKPSVFQQGFAGASGACFDDKGNFYQSNPFGHQVSKVSAEGTIDYSWCTEGLRTPVGLKADSEGNVYVANCGRNEIGKISPTGEYTTFAVSELFRCPNGLTRDPAGNLYACNFGDGKVFKISPRGEVETLVELPTLQGGPSPVGNGHLIYSNGWLFVTTIGRGELYRLSLSGEDQRIAGVPNAFANQEGDGDTGTFSKPNGIAASVTGDTLYINVSEPTWVSDPSALHPGKLMMVTGICSLPNSGCN